MLAALACEPSAPPPGECDAACQAALERAVHRELDNPVVPLPIPPCNSSTRATVIYDMQERPQRIERDCNGDGRADRWTSFGPDGAQSATQIDTDFDGTVDLRVPATSAPYPRER